MLRIGHIGQREQRLAGPRRNDGLGLGDEGKELRDLASGKIEIENLRAFVLYEFDPLHVPSSWSSKFL
jgi:hypothetical protein